MKRIKLALTLVVGLLIFTGCSKEDIIISSAFKYTVENCTSTNPELNECHQLIRFRDDHTASYLPYGDVFFTARYEVKKSTVTVSNPANGNLVYKLKIETDDLLIEEPSGNKWVRQPN